MKTAIPVKLWLPTLAVPKRRNGDPLPVRWVHIDGYNQLPYLTGQEDHSARRGFIYFDDDGQLVAIRVDNWRLVFFEQKTPGTLDIWGEPFTARRLPLFFNLRMDP